VKVDGASGVAYTTNVTSKLETILIPTRGRMYLLFGFDSAGVQQLHDMLKSFKFA
jgi:hypothetical protein